jgi:predicted ATP-grasp superfamily ATP-dependent carboligase
LSEPILLVAVSARMLAELAVRSGHEVVAFDRFGDLDLRALCPARGVPGPMAEIVEAAAGAEAPSVICGAGLENRPDLVERLAKGRELLGCPPSVLARVRDPAVLGASLRAAGFHHPRTYTPPIHDPGSSAGSPGSGGGGHNPRSSAGPFGSGQEGRWLRKPVRGGGGRGIREWGGEELPDGVMLQERIDGVPCSVAAAGDGRAAVVLGVTEQLIGRASLGGRGFAWCGNVTRSPMPDADAICDHLAAEFGLIGLFGVDFVWDGEHAWVVEVNPRPTGSLELFGAAAFDAHLEACAGRLPARAAPADGAAGKAIVYATHDTDVGDTSEWPARGIRDVPHPGERIDAGNPICTLLATGPTPEAVLAELDDRAAALRAELRVHAIA